MRKKLSDSHVLEGHQDFELLSRLEEKIVSGAGGLDNLKHDFPLMLRRIVDNVVDAPRTGRRVYEELEKTEKTYIGTRVEIELRAYLGFPKGKLDLSIDGLDVDIKHTMGDGWMIPMEAIDHPCILVAADEQNARCFLGLIIARTGYLTASANRDAKKSISAEGTKHIKWLIRGDAYPPNFWRNVSSNTIDSIFAGNGGTTRLAVLFTAIQGIPIDRDTIFAVAKQVDSMKRLRSNGGARDKLLPKGILLLSGQYDSKLIAEFNLPECTGKEFISFKVENDAQKLLARKNGFLVP